MKKIMEMYEKIITRTWDKKAITEMYIDAEKLSQVLSDMEKRIEELESDLREIMPIIKVDYSVNIDSTGKEYPPQEEKEGLDCREYEDGFPIEPTSLPDKKGFCSLEVAKEMVKQAIQQDRKNRNKEHYRLNRSYYGE